MVGKRDGNLRRGDIAEQLGVLLLQGLAAVAPVPRTEDTGVDLIATLLRREGGRHLIAEDSIYIQLKARSIEEITLEGLEIDWLHSLKLPFFIGSVDMKQCDIQLYSAHAIYEHMASGMFPRSQKLRLLLLSGSPVGWDAEGERRLHLGPPILNWKMEQLADDGFVRHAYSVLKAHVRIIQDSFIHALAGFSVKVAWETGELPSLGNPSQSIGSTESLQYILDKAWPFLHSWYFHLLGIGRTDDASVLLELTARMQEVGWKVPTSSLMDIRPTIRSLLNDRARFMDTLGCSCWLFWYLGSSVLISMF